MRIRSLGFIIVSGMALAGALGCQEESIRSYDVPRAEAPSPEPSSAGKPQVRMIVAMLPHGEQTWFFKLLGPAEVIGKHQDEFERFLQSVRFTNQGERPVEWKVPESWTDQRTERGNAGMIQRYATFRVGTAEPSGELTVTALGREAGSLLANVNRWRGQIGLKPIGQKELAQVSRPLKVENDEGTLVDMTGASSLKAAKGMMPSNHPPVRPPTMAAAPIKYTTPEGWKEMPASGMRAATFIITEGSRKAEVTITPLGREASDVLANVNRWRGELQLPPIREEELAKEVREVEAAGVRAAYVDLQGPSRAGLPPERTLAIILPRSDRTWFVKMRGPADIVQKQKAAFEAFVRSLEFTGGTGANHG